VAFAIGRALGPAVVRNRLRRRLRMLLTSAALPPGWYLFGGTPAIVERPFDALRADVNTLCSAIQQRARPDVSRDSCG
jgi:ribonuclease P protein component